MHQKKNRPIHDKYKINQQKNQKDIKLNENILKTNISEINESQDEKSQYNNQEKLKKKKYNDRENRFMQKKQKERILIQKQILNMLNILKERKEIK